MYDDDNSIFFTHYSLHFFFPTLLSQVFWKRFLKTRSTQYLFSILLTVIIIFSEKKGPQQQ